MDELKAPTEEERDQLVDRIIADFQRTYEKFLKTSGLPNVPVVRLGFYSTVIEFVSEEELPVPEVQDLVLNILSDDALQTYREAQPVIHQMFIDTSRKTKA